MCYNCLYNFWLEISRRGCQQIIKVTKLYPQIISKQKASIFQQSRKHGKQIMLFVSLCPYPVSIFNLATFRRSLNFPNHYKKSIFSVSFPFPRFNIASFLPVSCRHAAIANYFGDDVPQCNRSCDYCKNPAAVKKQVEALQHSTKSWSRTYIGPSASSWNACDPELYGGGKRGSRGFERQVCIN